jgi:tetratricopeptide (TPR) repeat protein
LSDALDALNAHLETQPDDEAARRLRAAVRLRTGAFMAALADMETLASHTADDHVQRSVIFERLGDLDLAVEAMQQAQTVKSGDERLAERLVGLLLQLRRYQEAQALIDQMPKTWRWQQWAGDTAAQSGEDTRAVTHYGEALAMLSQHFDLNADRHAAAIQARLLLARADAYSQLEQYDAAEADYLAAAKIIPDDPMIPFKRGLLAAGRGDLETAVSLCREAMSTANDVLRAGMEGELKAPRYHELAERLQWQSG